MLSVDQEKLKDLKEKSDKYLELFNSNNHWKLHTKELESWYNQTRDLGKKYIKMEDLIEYQKLGEFINCSYSIHGNKLAVNIKHNMKKTLKRFYSVFLILYKKLYGKSYPTEKLPKII